MAVIITTTGKRKDVTKPGREDTEQFSASDQNGAQSISSTPTTIELDTVDINTRSSYFTLSSDELTINKSGKADVNLRLSVSTPGTGDYQASMWLERNGTEVAGSRGFLGKGT